MSEMEDDNNGWCKRKIDGKVILEVGGNKKSFDQIADIPDSYILADDMEYPVGKKLPLWIVGMNY